MLTSDSLQFLYDLSQNNNRDWFEKNKKRYEAVLKKPFEATVAALIERLLRFEPGFGPLAPKDCIFRIHRDTRFSKDKSPYKTNVAAAFTPKGTKGNAEMMSYPGYYFSLEFGNLWIGGGAYFLDKEPLHRVRTAIAQDPEAFRALLDEKDLAEKFGGLAQSEVNKVMPPDLKDAAKQEPLLLNKQFYFMAEMDPETALRPDFPDFLAEHFRAGKPLNDWLRSVIFAT
jgi:uncharacterized protein (TIGR02453 family)